MSKQSKQLLIPLFGALVLLLIIYTVMVVVYLAPRRAIRNLDFWHHVAIGQKVRWNDLQTLSHGFYPLGYPLLLSLAIEVGLDSLRFAHFLSWSGGLLALTSLFSIVYSMTRSVSFAFSGTLLLLLNRYFLFYATYEGNDMLAAGLQAAALTAVWYGTSDHSATSSKPLIFLSGLLLGLAYLTRYTALILLPIMLLYLLVKLGRSPKTMRTGVALILLSFLLMTAVQWLPSLIVHGNPFYNAQAKNVWFAIHGRGDWVNNWNKVPNSISITEVVAVDPMRFIRHWFQELAKLFTTLRLWPLPLQHAWLLSLPMLLFSMRPVLSRRLLMLMTAVFPIAMTAMAWLEPRFILFSLWTQALFIAWLAFSLKDLLALPSLVRVVSVAGVLLVMAVAFQWQEASRWLLTSPLTRPHQVNSFLRLAGMKKADQAATNDPYLHATDEPCRTRYAQTYFAVPNPTTPQELLCHPAAADWQYLVLDYEHSFGQYAGLRDAFVQSKSYLVPLMLSEQRDVFCMARCALAQAQPVDLDFGNGIHLIGYRLCCTGTEGALYLCWQAECKLERSYKISVRLTDATGKRVVQMDGIPQLGTFPTTEWPVQEPIVDFYTWHDEHACCGCRLSIAVSEQVVQ